MEGESGGEREQGEGQDENESTCTLERVRMRREGGMEDKNGQRVRGREGCSTKSVLPLELSWW